MLPPNWRAVRMFADEIAGQWRVVPMVGTIGLDLPGVEAALRLAGVPRAWWRDLFRRWRIMEGAALKAIRGTG